MNTTIEWTHRRLADGTMIPGYTFNVVWGCTKVSEGCRDCYALTFAHRLGLNLWGPGTPRRTFSVDYWKRPLLWNQQAQRRGHRSSVFCSSMADVFEDHPTVAQEREKLWPLIAQTPWLNWLLLTKRPEHVMQMVPWGQSFPDNVWIGTSVENQERAEERIPWLLRIPACVLFLSCEPLLEALDLTAWLHCLDWIIVGGESGKRARRMNPEWALAIREQCAQAAVRFFFKQHGGRFHNEQGRLLDGRTYDAMPDECPAVTWRTRRMQEVVAATSGV